MVHAQGLKGAVQLAHAVLPQCLAVVGASGFANLQVLQLRRDNLAQLTAGRGDEVHLSALLGVVGHRRAGRGGFVVGVRVHKEDARLLRGIVRGQ